MKNNFFCKIQKNASSQSREGLIFRISDLNLKNCDLFSIVLDRAQTHKLNDMPRVTDYKRTMKVVVGVKFATKIALRFGKNIVVIGHLNYLVNFPCDCYLCSQIFYCQSHNSDTTAAIVHGHNPGNPILSLLGHEILDIV